MSGVPGFRTSDTGGLISNVCVTSVEENDTAYLYKDSFVTKDGYTEALDTTSTYNYSLTSECLKHNAASGNKFSLFQGIEGASSLKNYTVSANCEFVNGTDKNTYNGVIAYGSLNGSANTYGYEFAIAQGYFRLYRRDNNANNGTDTLAGGKDVASALATSVFAEEKYTVGKPIRLSLTAITNADNSSVTLICKA